MIENLKPFDSPRTQVMEKGVALETGISSLLGMLLDIDVNESLSLGSKNMALGMSQKVNLLCDLKFVPKNLIWQFQLFTSIRNKFAHLQHVDCFVECFKILKNDKSKLLKEFDHRNELESEPEELRLSTCFSMLCISISIWLQLVLKKTKFNKTQDLKKTAVIESLRDFFKNSEKNKLFYNEQLSFVDNLINDIAINKDFVESIEEARSLNRQNEK
jgi:6-pyruvoyl-tetrahydropterin synthase